MKQFLVMAYDYPGVLAKRLEVRPAHQANVQPLEAKGMMVAGGPILDADGKPCGTVCIANVADRAELDSWLENDPYRTQGVWERIEITPMMVAFPR